MPPIGREISPGHRIISASMVPDELSCPHCGSKSFTVIGLFKRPFEQPYVNGQLNKEGLVLNPNAFQTIQGLACPSCNVHTIIEEDEVFERELLIFDLQTQITTLQGRTVTSTGREWVQ